MGIRQPCRRHVDEAVDSHYRQLYQIRRAHGDVISRVGLLFSHIAIRHASIVFLMRRYCNPVYVAITLANNVGF